MIGAGAKISNGEVRTRARKLGSSSTALFCGANELYK